TLLEPVRLLDGGTVATVRGNTLNTESYWRFEQTSTTSKPVETLKQEFADRLIEAVRLRLPRHAPVYISLSAGGDSRAILGILAESLRVPNVRSFSYAHGPIQPDSDEALSRQ